MTIMQLAGATPSVDSTAFVATTAVLIGNVHIAADASIWYGAVLRAEEGRIQIGALSNIQDNCTVHCDERHPVMVCSRVTVGHNAVLHGCTIEDEVVIGIGALVLDGARVERGAVVAAGAVVPPGQVIGAGVLARGIPARPVGPVPPSLRDQVAQIPESYRALGQEHDNPMVLKRSLQNSEERS